MHVIVKTHCSTKFVLILCTEQSNGNKKKNINSTAINNF